MVETSKSAAKKAFRSIPRKNLGMVVATSRDRKPVVIVTCKNAQVIRIYDGKYYMK